MFSITTRYNSVSNKINNLVWLDKRENYDYKSFFYINLSAKVQEELITSDNKTFIKELEKTYYNTTGN